MIGVYRVKIRVYYEDTDAGGIVYHTNYIKYCERARSEIFFAQNKQPTDGEGSGFVVRKIDADFLGTSKLGDMLSVESKLVSQKNSSIILEQNIYKEDKKIFSMHIVLVFVRQGKPARIPEQFNTIFKD